uniref:Uncharacterized protein n=1 Tax=Ciona savignyi TaxID=51511 RepID=H2YNL9_CIOSA
FGEQYQECTQSISYYVCGIACLYAISSAIQGLLDQIKAKFSTLDCEAQGICTSCYCCGKADEPNDCCDCCISIAEFCNCSIPDLRSCCDAICGPRRSCEDCCDCSGGGNCLD